MFRGDFPLLIVCCGVFAIIVVMVLSSTSRRKRAADHERRRLDLIEKALQHPNLDEPTRRELLQAIAGPRGPAPVTAATVANLHRNWWPMLWFGAGWLLFVIGGCVLAAGALDLMRGVEEEVVLPLAIAGFAILTLPAALRELTRRGGTEPIGR